MNDHKLTPSEARAVIRRHAHDLRNMLCSMDLQIACLLEEPESARGDAPQKLLHQLALTEEIVRSLAVRFQEPALRPASAADIFETWRRQHDNLRQGVPVQWKEPASRAAITVDFNDVVTLVCEIHHDLRPDVPVQWKDSSSRAALTVDVTAIVTVLCEICLHANSPAGIVAGFTEKEDAVCFSIGEPATPRAYRDTLPEAQQWKEWERLVQLSGGKIERSYDPVAARTVTALRFAVHETQSGPTPRVTGVSRIPRAVTFDEVEHAA